MEANERKEGGEQENGTSTNEIPIQGEAGPVSQGREDVEEVLEVIKSKMYAGRIRLFSSNWEKITSNKHVLEWIKAYKLPFDKNPSQKHAPKQTRLSRLERKHYADSVEGLLKIGAIKQVRKCKGQFISTYFLRQKPDGSYRFILNLKSLNKFITAPHFKLEDIRTAKNIISKNCYMASVDLKDAYFLIPIHYKYKKFLRFNFQGKTFEFQCLPFGLCTAPYLFTKIFKSMERS